MNHQLTSHFRRIAAEALASTTSIRMGEVTSFDPDTYLAKVTIQPDGYETGWMPVLTHWVGNGWGLLCPPTKGDQVVVAFDGGSVESGVILGGVFSDVQRPLQTPQGEFWLVHQSGSSVKLTNDGKVTAADAHGSSLALNNDGTVASAGAWTHTGTLHVTDNLSCDKTVSATTDVVGGGKSLKTHPHTGVQTGSGVSGPPQ